MVRLLGLIRAAALAFIFAGESSVKAQEPTQWPLHNDGLNDVVQWDHFSFEIKGQRAFLFSGDFHYWRLPVPELWEDILQKIKAAGLNSFTFYAHWGYHAPNPDTVDFTNGAHNYSRLYELAKEIGLYVLVRPGPYINAEASAGGMPGWITDGKYGALRDNFTAYTKAWEPYLDEFTKLTVPHQITQGGNALAFQIENEYGNQWIDITTKTPNLTAAAYMTLLEQSVRSGGIDIPLTHNNPNMNSKSWSKDFAPGFSGDVDVYGIDSYPSCWSCNLAECTTTNGPFVPYQVVEYYSHFQQVSPTQPEFMPEFQGGGYNPWGGPAGGCLNNSDFEFVNLFYRNNIAERVTAMNLYMFYGGTNWGWIATPVTATSYDYNAPISEDRSISDKYYETKNLALFTKVAADLTVTNRIGNGTQFTHNAAITGVELRNPDTNAGFYIIRHTNSSSNTFEAFNIKVSTSIGNLSIPQELPSMSLSGHQSKIIVTDFTFGAHSLAYSTAEVLSYSTFSNETTLVLWVPDGESGEFFVKSKTTGSVLKGGNAKISAEKDGLLVTFNNQQGMTVVEVDTGLRVLMLDRTTSYPFFVPSLSTDPLADASFNVFVQGAYLIRGASVTGTKVALTGDIINSTTIEVFAGPFAESLTFNGEQLKVTKTSYGSLTAFISGTSPMDIVLPQLTNWKVHDSLPERFASYDDSGPAWKDADHDTTSIPQKPETLPVLYFDEYGFHQGVGLWRGSFIGNPSDVFVSVQGGTAFGWSAWLNGDFIGSWLGNNVQFSQQGNVTLSFANATLNTNGTENLLLIVQDNSGHDETSGASNPRGILNTTLIGPSNSSFTKWKVAGTAGGDFNILDPMRGDVNEGGLTAERLGWHLPGFDDSTWNISSPSSIGLSGAGIQFYRSRMPLNVPKGLDTSLSFELSSLGSKKLRALLFVNGYQYARFNPWMGNQVEYPVPPGILNYNGDNTIGLAVWAQTVEGAQVGVDVKFTYIAKSSLDVTFDSEYLRPNWTSERLQYI